jgi:hypothetical protein
MEPITELGETLAGGRLFLYLGWQRRPPIGARMAMTQVWHSMPQEAGKATSSYSYVIPASCCILQLSSFKCSSRSTRMDKPRSLTTGYILAALVGATVGGIAVAIVTKAIPGMISRMMGNMMMRMGREGCDPEGM